MVQHNLDGLRRFREIFVLLKKLFSVVIYIALKIMWGECNQNQSAAALVKCTAVSALGCFIAFGMLYLYG